MKNYTNPEMTITKFAVEDIITASGAIVDATTLTGADKEMYEVYKENSAAKNTNISVFTW